MYMNPTIKSAMDHVAAAYHLLNGLLSSTSATGGAGGARSTPMTFSVGTNYILTSDIVKPDMTRIPKDTIVKCRAIETDSGRFDGLPPVPWSYTFDPQNSKHIPFIMLASDVGISSIGPIESTGASTNTAASGASRRRRSRSRKTRRARRN